MKNLFKTLILVMVFMFTINSSFAFSVGKLEKMLKKSNLKIEETSTLAISIKNVDTNEVVYEKNQNKLLHPASTLKLFTTYASMDVLGYDYTFKTQFYKDSENNLYIRLGADPLLSATQLKQAIYSLKEAGETSFNNLYFDDSVIDKKEFSSGWMWDDDINPHTPKVSAYNLDGNVVSVDMDANQNGLASTTLKSTYPMSVISYIQTGAKKDYIDIGRYNWTNPEVVEIYANVTSPKSLTIPISSMRRYFIHNLEKAIEDNGIKVKGTSYSSKLLPERATLITEVLNPVAKVVPLSLQNSNNLMSETLYKLAASKKYNATGTTELAAKMFEEFCEKNDIDTKSFVIQDGSGVSRKNLMSVDWMTAALNKLAKRKDFEQFKENMAQTGDGTLSNRLHDLRGEAWLKTGSLSGVSGITGYVKSQDGNTYSIAILVQNFMEEQETIKTFEDEIIKIIYNK